MKGHRTLRLSPGPCRPPRSRHIGPRSCRRFDLTFPPRLRPRPSQPTIVAPSATRGFQNSATSACSRITGDPLAACLASTMDQPDERKPAEARLRGNRDNGEDFAGATAAIDRVLHRHLHRSSHYDIHAAAQRSRACVVASLRVIPPRAVSRRPPSSRAGMGQGLEVWFSPLRRRSPCADSSDKTSTPELEHIVSHVAMRRCRVRQSRLGTHRRDSGSRSLSRIAFGVFGNVSSAASWDIKKFYQSGRDLVCLHVMTRARSRNRRTTLPEEARDHGRRLMQDRVVRLTALRVRANIRRVFPPFSAIDSTARAAVLAATD